MDMVEFFDVMYLLEGIIWNDLNEGDDFHYHQGAWDIHQLILEVLNDNEKIIESIYKEALGE